MKYTPGCDLKKFVNSLTLQQKIALQVTKTIITSEAFEELAIPSMCIADGVTGISYLQIYLDRLHKIEDAPSSAVLNPRKAEEENDNLEDEVLRDYDKTYETAEEGTIQHTLAKALVDRKPNGKDPTCFPSGAVLGSTWNPELVYNCGQLLGKEMAAFGVDVVLGPNMDIQRDPLCGRGYECYSEDPLLVGQIGSAFIRGMQSVGVAGCAKHFAVNNQETNRSSINALVSERALREIYLKGFEYAVKFGKVKSIMMAYNKVNGAYCAENERFMKEIIRDEWGFEGCIVSDWGAAYHETTSIKAGLDMVLPQRKENIEKAVADGELSEEELDRCVYWILKMYEDLNGMTGRPNPSQYNDKAALKCVYDCVVDGAVLLKNNDVLPLAPGTKTAFWGKRSRKLMDCGGGSTQVYTKKTSSILERARLIGDGNCLFEETAEDTEALVYTVAYPGHEGTDNTCLLPEHEDRVKIAGILRQAKERGLKTVVVLNTAGPVDVRDWITYADALLCVYLPGCEGANAVADMLYGICSPAGRLAQTFPIKYEDTPSCINFPGYNGTVNYGEGIFVGYRYYDKKEIEPAFPFGYGLTYTTFAMNTAAASGFAFDADTDNVIKIPVTVKNTGDRDGSEVVQLYVGQHRPFVEKPVRELRGFVKVFLKPGQQTTVSIPLKRDAFTHYDEEKGGWCVEPGDYTVYIGSSSRELPIELSVTVCGRSIYGIGAHTAINKIAESDHAVDCLCAIMPDFKERIPEFLRDFNGEALVQVYDAIMSDYYINPIHGATVFENACKKMNQNCAL